MSVHWANLDLVARRRAALSRVRWPAIFIPALVVAAIFSMLYLNQAGDIATTGYDLTSLQQEKQRWEIRNEQLKFEVARLESLDRVASLARADLKMGPPQKVVYVTGDQLPRPRPTPLSHPSLSPRSP